MLSSRIMQETSLGLVKKTIIPSRDLTALEVLGYIRSNNDAVFIDSLDPSSSHVPAFNSIATRNLEIRKQLSGYISGTSKYIYLSTSNLYSSSTYLVDETSKTASCPSGSYLHLKYQSEQILRPLVECLSICRIPALWSNPPKSNGSSFFDDLIVSRINNIKLSSREGDESVLSYLNLDQASNSLSRLAFRQLPSLFNLTSLSWSTRTFLKSGIPYIETKCPGVRLSSQFKELIIPDPILL